MLIPFIWWESYFFGEMIPEEGADCSLQFGEAVKERSIGLDLVAVADN
jgi:hypothetical protein